MSRNLADCLSLDREPVTRLLRAGGTTEDILATGSDYDRFAALAAVLPQAPGHSLAETLAREARVVTRLRTPLCPHTAPDFWRAWTDIHWYGKDISAVEAPLTPCPHCVPAAPTVLREGTVTLPDPAALTRSEHIVELDAFARRLVDALPSRGGYALLRLSRGDEFARPDPYHAANSLRAQAEGRATAPERALLLAQALRILGEAAKARNVTLLLLGGKVETVLEGLAYLHDRNRLPAVVWLPEDSADAAHVCGLYPQVRTGYVVERGETPTALARKRAAYAQGAPLGCAVEMYL